MAGALSSKIFSKGLRYGVLMILASPGLYSGNHLLGTRLLVYRSPNVPFAFGGFRILQVSDFHSGHLGPGSQAVLRAIKKAKPDLIVMTGDLIDSRNPRPDKVIELVRGACQIAPVYYVTGNHEARSPQWPALQKALAKSQATFLDQSSRSIVRGQQKIELIGCQAPAFGGESIQKWLSEKIKRLPPGRLSIVLAHHPEYLEQYEAAGADLVLSGHAHGGQIRLPYGGGMFSPGQGFWPRHSAGMQKRKSTSLVISRGLGNSLFPLRVFNPPELVLIELQDR